MRVIACAYCSRNGGHDTTWVQFRHRSVAVHVRVLQESDKVEVPEALGVRSEKFTRSELLAEQKKAEGVHWTFERAADGLPPAAFPKSPLREQVACIGDLPPELDEKNERMIR